MAKSIYRCPECGCSLAPNRAGFWQCNWRLCAEYGRDWTEYELSTAPRKTDAEIAAYRAWCQFTNRNASPNTNNYPFTPKYTKPIPDDEDDLVKEVRINLLYQFTIVELQFVTVPRRSWFVANIQPIIDIIKLAIPASAREYDSSTYKWQIAAEYWPSLEQILIASQFKITRTKSTDGPANVHVPEAYAESFYHEQVVATHSETKESIAIQLASLLGIHEDIAKMELAALKRKYREAARLYHPDLGGDAAKMATLNYLWKVYNAGDKN